MAQTPPRWNMSIIYPSLSSTEFNDAFSAALKGIDSLSALFDKEGINKQDAQPFTPELAAKVDRIIGAYNEFFEQFQTVAVYISCHIATDSRDELAQAKQSELSMKMVTLNKLGSRFTAWIGCLPVEEIIEASQVAKEHAFFLRKTKFQSTKQMAPEEEALAARPRSYRRSSMVSATRQRHFHFRMRNRRQKNPDERCADHGLRSQPRNAAQGLRSRTRWLEVG